MDLVPSASYSTPLDGGKAVSLISNTRQKKYARCMPPTAVQMPAASEDDGDLEDDFPTPRANPNTVTTDYVSQPIISPGYPEEWKLRFSSASTSTKFEDEEDIYGTISDNDDDDSASEYSAPSDDGSEVVPFRVSDSIRKILQTTSRKADPRVSLVIPSPAMWPTVEKLAKAAQPGGDLPLSSPRTPLSPAALARLAANNSLLVPAQSHTPSLAESITSDGVSSLSCPSTPDLRFKADDEEEAVSWDLPIQLHPEAMETLLHISNEYQSPEETELERPVAPPRNESDPTPPMAEKGLKICLTIPISSPALNEDEFSALSVPSPGGFFASLRESSSEVWAFPKKDAPPSTSAAETFYGVPWRKPPPKPLERVVELEEVLSDGPPTARRITEELEAKSAPAEEESVSQAVDYDAEYERKLHESATANMSRTSVWLTAQEGYLAAFNGRTDEAQDNEDAASPKTPVPSIASKELVDDASTKSPSKKSVRFVDVETRSTTSTEQNGSPLASDSLFYHAFQHICKSKSGQDAFTSREVRAEAVRAERHYLPNLHRARLTNTYALVAPKDNQKGNEPWRAAPSDKEAEGQRELLVSVNKEQQALQQISLSRYYLDADRFLNQGSLLPQSIAALVKQQSKNSKNKPRILDLGGEPTASWGWAVALEYREAKVYTVVPASQGQSAGWTAHRGPSNHRTVTVPNAWTLPFPAGSFDVVSSRTLHSMLRNTSPTRDGGDEYDATLAEIRRVLAPGGHFHFSVMDAEVTAPANSLVASRSIEFAVSLRTRGYEPSAGRRLVSKLEKAGFGDVKRSWMSLPIGGEEPNGMAAVTGLFGSLAWEKWMLKLQRETGRPEERLLDGIAKAFDEAKASKDGASWRMLVGCAQKT